MIARHCWKTVVVNVLLVLPSRPRDLAPGVSILVMTMREMPPDGAPGCRRWESVRDKVHAMYFCLALPPFLGDYSGWLESCGSNCGTLVLVFGGLSW